MSLSPPSVYGFPSKEIAQFPSIVQIALMHYICNSSCKHCPVGLVRTGEMGQDRLGEFDPKRRRFFALDVFFRVAWEMSRYPWSILRFHGRGEPLLHPHFVEMVAYAKRVHIGCVTSFTNATLLDEAMAEQILDAEIDVLELSVDAVTPETYRAIRRTEMFETVRRNAQRFLAARNRRGKATKTRVIVSAVDSPEFQSEKQAFLEYWRARADQVIVRPYHTYGGRLPVPSTCPSGDLVPCSQLWTRFSINPWGQVNACFNDWGDEEIIGDLNEPGASIAALWRSDAFERLRAASLADPSGFAFCGSCLATRAGWVQTYEVLLEKLRQQQPNPACT